MSKPHGRTRLHTDAHGRWWLAICLMLMGVATGQASAPVYVMPDTLRNSKDFTALQAFVEKAESQGSYDLAADGLRRVLELRPKETGVAVHLVEDLYRAGDASKPEASERASELLARADLSQENRVRMLIVRGLIAFERGELDPAAKDFDEALSLDSGNVRAGIGKAGVETQQGKFAEASNRLEALGSSGAKYDVETRYLLRWALKGQTGEGAEPAAMGKLMYRAGRMAEAEQLLRTALSQSGGDVRLWNLVAGLCAQRGDADGAKAAIEASLALNPEQPEMKKFLEQLGKT